MKDSFYFITCGTESELSFIEGDLREKCGTQNIEVIYFRKLKTGHIPTYREIKLKCEKWRALKIIEDLKMIMVDKSSLKK